MKSRLRLSVFRSNKYIYAQIIDDSKGETKISISDRGNLNNLNNLKKIERSRQVGKLLANEAVKKGIKTVYYDRGKYRYHGRIKALAEGAREGGLDF